MTGSSDRRAWIQTIVARFHAGSARSAPLLLSSLEPHTPLLIVDLSKSTAAHAACLLSVRWHTRDVTSRYKLDTIFSACLPLRCAKGQVQAQSLPPCSCFVLLLSSLARTLYCDDVSFVGLVFRERPATFFLFGFGCSHPALCRALTFSHRIEGALASIPSRCWRGRALVSCLQRCSQLVMGACCKAPTRKQRRWCPACSPLPSPQSL